MRIHADFNDKAEEMAQAEGFENWIAHLGARLSTAPTEPYPQPKLAAWVMESRDSTGKYSVRNPYFFAVDAAGNQLPYIDTLRAIFFADKQVAILNMMQGKVDIGGRMMTRSFARTSRTGGGRLRLPVADTKRRVIFRPNITAYTGQGAVRFASVSERCRWRSPPGDKRIRIWLATPAQSRSIRGRLRELGRSTPITSGAAKAAGRMG